MAYCTNCGASLPEDAHFCPECGHREEESDNPPQPPRGRTPSPDNAAPAASGSGEKTKKLSPGAIAGIALGCLTLIGIAIAALFVLLLFGLSGPLEETSDIYFGLISDGDLLSAYELTSPAFQANTSEEDFRRFVQSNPLIMQIVETNFSSTQIENDRARASGELVTAGGETVPVEMMFFKDPDLGWQIEAIQFGDG